MSRVAGRAKALIAAWRVDADSMTANLLRVLILALVDIDAVGSMIALRANAGVVVLRSRRWMTSGVVMTWTRHASAISIDAFGDRYFKLAKLPIEAFGADAIVAAVGQT